MTHWSLRKTHGGSRINVLFLALLLRPLALLILFGLAGCESMSRYVPSFISPHKVEIQQGNVITPEQVAQLKEGMTRDQVRFLLGTPLLTDVFHTNRWDYLFRLKKSDGTLENSKLTIFFDDNRLQKFITTLTVPATENPSIASNAAAAAPLEPPAPQPIQAPSGATITPIVPPVIEQKTEQPSATPPDTATTIPTAPAAATNNAALGDFLEGWRTAWESRNVDQYLACYASSFQPTGMNRAEWEMQRRERLGKPKQIKLKLENIKFESSDTDHAKAGFTQIYASDLFRERGRKTLTLIKENGQWKIAAEEFRK